MKQLNPCRTTRYGKCVAKTGTVVGLEKISEQYIRGRGFIAGSSHTSGHYTGAHGGVAASGGVRGFGSIFGQAELWTEYHYETRFFLRENGGQDNYITITGDRLPILTDHTITAIFVHNDLKQSIVFAIGNHNTKQVFCTLSERELIEFLGIRSRKTVKQQLLSLDERRSQLDRHNKEYGWIKPWLVLTLLIGLALIPTGILVARRLAGLGNAFIAIGFVSSSATIITYLWLWNDARLIRSQQLYEYNRVRNPEVDVELDDIINFVDEVMRQKLLT